MCLRRGALVAIFMVLLGSVFLTSASASHCTGDKDHLQDGSCGYFTQPSVPSATPTPSPTPTLPVTVENFPGNQDVTVTNWPTPAPGSGWTDDDRALLLSIGEYVRAGLVMLVFLIGAGLVVLLPFPRKGA